MRVEASLSRKLPDKLNGPFSELFNLVKIGGQLSVCIA